MPCNHRFIEWLDLSEPMVDHTVETLIVGTFNPSWPDTNYAQWFYGRTANNYFWKVLPEVYFQPSLMNESSDKWVKFCRDYKIGITDLLTTIHDAHEENQEHRQLLGDFKDSTISAKFSQYLWTDIPAILKNRDIKYVYLTRTASGLWKTRWEQIQSEMKGSGVHFTCLQSPSKAARFSYTKEQQKFFASLPDFICAKWKQMWHPINMLS